MQKGTSEEYWDTVRGIAEEAKEYAQREMEEDCSTCDGSGEEDVITECKDCFGTGVAQDGLCKGEDCLQCDGEGESVGGSEMCGECAGTGTVCDKDGDTYREYLDQYVRESVDGSAYIIYYANQLEVIEYTNNEQAYEDYGPLTGDWDKIKQTVAYCAMVADVMDQLNK